MWLIWGKQSTPVRPSKVQPDPQMTWMSWRTLQDLCVSVFLAVIIWAEFNVNIFVSQGNFLQGWTGNQTVVMTV